MKMSKQSDTAQQQEATYYQINPSRIIPEEEKTEDIVNNEDVHIEQSFAHLINADWSPSPAVLKEDESLDLSIDFQDIFVTKMRKKA